MSAALAPVRVGRDLLPGGRVVGLLAGLYFLASVVAGFVAVSDGALSWQLVAQVGLVSLLLAAGYSAVVAVLGGRLLVRVDPWLAAILLYAPLALILTLPFVPRWAAVGANLYIGISLVVEGMIGYGGCEIVGIPALVLRRRYTVYCLFNGADVAERAARGHSRWLAGGVALITFVLTVSIYEAALSVVSHGGRAGSPWLGYLVFLVSGFAVNRILVATSGR